MVLLLQDASLRLGLCLKAGGIVVLSTPSEDTLGPLFLRALALALGSATSKDPV